MNAGSMDPRGRLDILAYRVLKRLAERSPETRAAWEAGAKYVATWVAAVLPRQPLWQEAPWRS